MPKKNKKNAVVETPKVKPNTGSLTTEEVDEIANDINRILDRIKYELTVRYTHVWKRAARLGGTYFVKFEVEMDPITWRLTSSTRGTVEL